MRILIVEDEDTLRAQVAARLRKEGYAVDEAANAVDGEHIGIEYPIDAAIVDLGLPDKPGYDVIKIWRSQKRNFPILILTARSRWEEKVAGLECGADDYLVKPFHPEELSARLRALLRRAAGHSQPLIQSGPIVLDMAAKRVHVSGQEVALTALEYKVLEHLILHAGDVLSKSELTEHIYEQDLERDSNVLEVIVGRLRRKLDPDQSLSPIDTVRGRGYRLRFRRSV
ncbi:MAG: response regulator [Gammaproteobacteria bacterium]